MEHQHALFSALSGVLWLGNIDIKLDKRERAQIKDLSRKWFTYFHKLFLIAAIVAVSKAADLLGVSAMEIAQLITTQVVSSGNRSKFRTGENAATGWQVTANRFTLNRARFRKLALLGTTWQW